MHVSRNPIGLVYTGHFLNPVLRTSVSEYFYNDDQLYIDFIPPCLKTLHDVAHLPTSSSTGGCEVWDLVCANRYSKALSDSSGIDETR